MPDRTPPPHRFIYVIGPAEGLQKVGIATDSEGPVSGVADGVPLRPGAARCRAGALCGGARRRAPGTSGTGPAVCTE